MQGDIAQIDFRVDFCRDVLQKDFGQGNLYRFIKLDTNKVYPRWSLYDREKGRRLANRLPFFVLIFNR